MSVEEEDKDEDEEAAEAAAAAAPLTMASPRCGRTPTSTPCLGGHPVGSSRAAGRSQIWPPPL